MSEQINENQLNFGNEQQSDATKGAKVTFKYEDSAEHPEVIAYAQNGETLLELARKYDVSIEGSCGGSCSCATCHVWVADPWFAMLPIATEDEEDMLDNGQQLKKSSRLCCQIIVEEQLDGIVVTIPKSSENTSGHHH